MNRKLSWGLAALIILLVVGSMLWFIDDLADHRELEKDLQKARQMTEEHNKAKELADANNPPPDEEGFKWVWRNGRWDKVPIDVPSDPSKHQPIEKPFTEIELSKYWDGPRDPNGKPFAINSKQRAELRRLRRYLSIGIEPPPKGYDYLLIDGEEIVIENGKPFLINMVSDTTQYWVETITGFAPTLQQYERYQELQRKFKEAKRDNDTTLIQQLSTEIDSLIADAQGKLPSLSTLGKADPSEYGTEAFEYSLAAKSNTILRAAYRHMGLGHLFPQQPRTITVDGQELMIIDDD